MPGVVNDFGTTLIGNNAAFGVGNPDTTITTTTATVSPAPLQATGGVDLGILSANG